MNDKPVTDVEFDWDEAYRQNTRKVVLPPPEECGQESRKEPPSDSKNKNGT